MRVGTRKPIIIPPGVDKDDNSYSTLQYADANRVRFYEGFPQTIGGWTSVMYGNNQTLNGVIRSLWAFQDITTGIEHLMVGSNTNLYSYENGNLYNITPLVTGTTAIANSLATNYQTMGNNPIATTSGSAIVTLTYSPFTQGLIQVGDDIKIAGVSGNPGGISNANLTGVFSVNSVSATTLTFTANGAASSGATGGGNAVIVSLRVINVTQNANGFSNGARIKILGAASMGGFADTDINVEGIVRNQSTNAYSYYLSAATVFATSSVSGGGGAATTVQYQIAAGNCDFSSGYGFGGGNFGLGVYGIGYPFTNGQIIPEIWSFDRYGGYIVLTPGNQGHLYQWDGDVSSAPTVVSGAPAAVNYVFTGRGQVITLGAGGQPNRVQTSDTNDITNWTIDATSNAFQQDVETASKFIAHGYVQDQYLLFTPSSVHLMIYVGQPQIWVIKDLLLSDGLFAPKAVMSFDNAVIWMGFKDIYIYNGSIVSTIPNNTVKQWFYGNINMGKYYKTFMYRNSLFNELWIFAPMFGANEPSNYIIWNWQEGHFTNGTLTRTAAETPNNFNRPQYLANGSCTGTPATILYLTEVPGIYTDDGSPMNWSLTTNMAIIEDGQYIQQIDRVIPSNGVLPLGTSAAGENLYNLTVYTKEYDQQLAPRAFGAFTVTSTTQIVDVRANGRQRQYYLSSPYTTGVRIEKFYEEVRLTTLR